MAKKAKNKNKLHFERQFELEFDNIESIEQVEDLLQDVTNHPFKFEQSNTDRPLQDDILYFDMQAQILSHSTYIRIPKALLLLQGEAQLKNQHLIIKGRIGFDRFPLTIVEIVFLVMGTFGVFAMWSMRSILSGLMCGSVAFFVLLAIVFRPLTFRHDVVRQIERVFTDATTK